MDPLIIFFGLGVGILIGLTGVGGGSLMTPLLLIVGGYSPTVAIGTDLAYGAVTKTLGGWQHLRAGNVDLRLSRYLAYGSVPGSIVGVYTLERLDDVYGDEFAPILLTAVAVALALAAAASLYRSLFRPGLVAKERDSALLQRRVSRVATVAIGAVLGFILGLTSVGSGALIGLALILLYKLRPRRVVGTDVFHAAVLLWTAALAHLVGGNVDFGLMGTILIGSLPGVWIGVKLVPYVPVAALRTTLGAVLAAASLGVSTKAGADIPAAAIIGVPLAIGVFAYVLHRRREQQGLLSVTDH
ncbi:MAG: sulfite exporter TauE/SafE family protein [Solirubrobacteraceae bacterium]